MLLLVATFQIKIFMRLRHQGQLFFHSTLEMVSVVALVVIMLLAIVLKSTRGEP